MELLKVTAVLALISVSWAGETENMLDGMQQIMTGSGPYFDPDFYAELVACIDQFDPALMAAVDTQWAGFKEFAQSQGDEEGGDPWPPCPQEKWYEQNCTTQEYGLVPVYEPCNYASNIAYYHTAMEICKKTDWAMPQEYVIGLFRSFVYLGAGSAFLHGSQTQVGNLTDIFMTDLFPFVAHQAAVSSLTTDTSSIIHELSQTPREMSAPGVTEHLATLFSTSPVKDWGSDLTALDVPEIRIGMCGYLITAFNFVLEDEQLDALTEWLLDNIEGIDEDIRVFCLDTFLPQIRSATEHIVLAEEEKANLANRVFATFIKLAYAAIWQEEILLQLEWLFTPEANELGFRLLPLVNAYANSLTGIDYYNGRFQRGVSIYPGDEWCNPLIPHAKWHLQAGIALTDLAFLTDEMYKTFLAHSPQ